MIGGLFLQTLGYFDGTQIGNFFLFAEQAGIFSYALPFLIIFSLIFGILTQIKLFQENKSINAIIALSVALMSLQFSFVPIFFSQIFPQLGVGLAVILVFLILAGLFIDPREKWIMYGLLGIGVIIAIVILVNTSNFLGLSLGYYLQAYLPTIIWIAVILGAIGIIVSSNKPKTTPYRPFWPWGPQEGPPQIEGRPS